MIKHFYSFVVETDTLFLEIDALEISDSEKRHLRSLAESHIHHSVLNKVLSELAASDRAEFLKHLNGKNQETIWKFLTEKIQDVEGKIKEAANVVKNELYKDIREAKSKRE